MKKIKIILIVFSISLIVSLFIISQNSDAMNTIMKNSPKPTNTYWLIDPTFYPPVKATIWAGIKQTQEAAALGPTPNFQTNYPPSQNLVPEDALLQKLSGTLAGYGILNEVDPPMDVEMVDGKKMSLYSLDRMNWYEERYDAFIAVWSGVSNLHPGKGVVYVVIGPHYNPYQNIAVVEHPQATGKLIITGAQEETLTLQSENMGTLYFDVPALSYVNSPEEKLPSATPVPTDLPEPLDLFKDDAWDSPGLVSDYSQTNTDLNYYINSPLDYDWFKFSNQVPGEISISLTRTPGNCALRVVRLGTHRNGDWGEIIGEDTSQGSSRKQVVITEAQPSGYEVRVWCPDGSYSTDKPYSLRIDIPKPEKVTPILECVSQNPDGSYTAHFGYDNPNGYTVTVGADISNSFHPAPVFRTGQPEIFAPGRVVDFFSVLFDGNGLTWTLDGGASTANRNSTRCP